MQQSATLPQAFQTPVGKAVTAVAATDIFTSAAHGYVAGDPLIFSGTTGGAGIVPGTTYYVINPTTNTFQVSATFGGAALDVTTDLTGGTVAKLFNWFNLKTGFLASDLGYIAKWWWNTQSTPLTDGVVIPTSVIQQYIQQGYLPA